MKALEPPPGQQVFAQSLEPVAADFDETVFVLNHGGYHVAASPEQDRLWRRGIGLLAEASQFIGMNAMSDLNRAFACSVPYLRLWGVVAGGWQMARAPHSSW